MFRGKKKFSSRFLSRQIFLGVTIFGESKFLGVTILWGQKKFRSKFLRGQNFVGQVGIKLS